MLVTDDEQLFQRVSVLRDHGRAPRDTMFFNREVAFKYKMSSMQAALGLAQLERIDELVERKREIFRWYRANLAGRPELTLNDEAPGTKNAYWMVTVIVDPELGVPKEELIHQLRAADIDTRPFFHPLSSIPAYADSPSAIGARERNPVAYRIAPYGVNLPSGLNLTKEDVYRVCEVLVDAVEALRGQSAALLRAR
jgi:perosamine synthetase